MNSDDQKETLLSRYSGALLDSGAFVVSKEPIKLRSGSLSHIYFNHNALLSKWEYLALLSDIYAYLLRGATNVRLGVVDSVMSPVLGGILAARLKVPLVVIKEKEIGHGIEDQVFGKIEGEVVLIDDMTSTGGILVRAADVLRSRGASVSLSCLCISRSEEADQVLAQNKIHLRKLTTFEDVVRLVWPKLSAEEKALVSSEIPTPDQ